jgi:hypothetical protein
MRRLIQTLALARSCRPSKPHQKSPTGTSWGALTVTQCGGRVWGPALLALCLVGATLCTLLLIAFQTGPVPTTPPLADKTFVSLSRAFAPSAQATRTQEQVAATGNNASEPSPNAEEGRALVPLASGSETASEANMGWVEVSRAARVHAGPSVSASTLRFYPVGTELHCMDYKQGWFRVADPTTSEQGWIYEKYIEANSVPDHTHVPSQPVLQPTQTGFELSAPRPSLVRAKTQRQKTEPAQPVIHRTELFADLLERAFSGY